MSVAEGDKAPDFTIAASGGRTVSLKAQRGKPFVLYFYPKADTPGCTREACAFEEALPQFAGLAGGIAVIGVSPDAIASIEKFAGKYALTFPLASDPDHAVASAYGVWVEKLNYGRKYMGIERSTFLIDAKGKVARAWRRVKVDGHAAQVMAAAAELTP